MKKITHYLRNILTLSVFLLVSHLAPGQSYTDSLAKDDHDIISSIAPYAADVRTAILDVSQYPQVLVKLERVQARSSQSFQDMISGYSREEQEKFYELGRFPDLMDQMAKTGANNPDQVKNILKDLPSGTQTRMVDVYTAHFAELVKMNDMYKASQDALQKIISSYPQNVQQDFQKVISMPDVMSLLTDNIDLTVSLGEDYKANPGEVTKQLDDLNGKITAENEKDLAEYKQQVASDPKLQSEMKSAADEFSSSYDYPDNPVYVNNNNYDNYPYPYWYGYPYWYATPIWYPRPMYYHTGFYYGAGGAMVVVGLPSRIYSSWFFGSGYRRYPTLYSHYNNYWNAHHGGYGNVYRGFNNEARSHYYNSNRPGGGRPNYNGNRSNPAQSNQHINRPSSRPVAPNQSTHSTRMNQMNVHPSNFNNRGLNQYHASQFHSMGWQKVGGGSRGAISGGSRGGSFGGGTRSSGGGFRSGGGARSGGGGGGRRGR